MSTDYTDFRRFFGPRIHANGREFIGTGTAIETARELYRVKMKGKTLEDDIAAYRKIPAGWVIELPDAFLMGRVVEISQGFAWMVDVAVGELRLLVRLMPFQLPFIAWHRDGEERLRVYRTERFLRLSPNRKSKIEIRKYEG